MKKKKVILIFTAVIFILALACYLIIRSWATTSYGKLNMKVAVMLKIKKYINPSSINGQSISRIREITDKDITRRSVEPIPFSNIKNINIHISSCEIPVRIYTPDTSAILPIVIYSHGGAWIGGSLDTHDNVCRKLSKNTNAIVISVGYRLAPESPFPAGLNDIYNVLLWTNKNGLELGWDGKHIAVAGDSAGGNLSAAVSLMSRERKVPKITCQVLVYPSTNIRELNTKSWSYFANDFNLSKSDMEKYISLYVPKKQDRSNPYASPLLAENFNGLPDTLIITAEFDALRDEGEAFGEKLKNAGVNVIMTRYKGVTHGFLTMNRISNESEKAIEQISLYLQKEFFKSENSIQ
jgi:acetyl esterase